MPARLRRPFVLLLLLAALAVIAIPASGASQGSLQRSIQAQRDRERTLGTAAQRLGRLEATAARAVSVLDARLAAVQSDLAAAQVRLAQTQKRLDAARTRAARLQRRADDVQTALGRLLRARYMNDPPDLVTVVLQANGFNALLEEVSFAKRVQAQDANLLQEVRVARRDARRQRALYAGLVPKQQRAADAVARQRDALATIRGAADRRRGLLAQAKQARLELLGAVRSSITRSRRQLASLRRAQRAAALAALKRLQAQQDQDVKMVGPGGPWAIPYAIVECESGGQNLPPNSAGASGYYQFLPSTWKGLGGSTPNAYQAPKAEQDRLAARLWNGGAGARNWDCAAIVGLL